MNRNILFKRLFCSVGVSKKPINSFYKVPPAIMKVTRAWRNIMGIIGMSPYMHTGIYYTIAM